LRRSALLLAALAAATRLTGQTVRAGALLETPPTARSISLGGAYGAVFGDEGSVFVNPAGLAPIRHVALGVSAEERLDGARLGTAAAALRLGRLTFGFGFGLMALDHTGDSIPVPDPAFGGGSGAAVGPQASGYNILGVGAIAYRRGMFSLGASVKGLREYVSDGSADAYVANGVTGTVGAGMAFFDIAAFGFAIENLAGTLSGGGISYSLPRTLRGGFTINFVDPQGTARILTTIDWVRPPEGNAYWVLAGETGIVLSGVGLVGRAGIAAGRSGSPLSDASFGGGLVLRSVRLDYASQGYRGQSQRTHRFGIRWVF
jgi:hypothetical protein